MERKEREIRIKLPNLVALETILVIIAQDKLQIHIL